MKLYLVGCYLSLAVLAVVAQEQPDHSKDFEVVELVNDEDPEYFDLENPAENTADKSGSKGKGRPAQAPQRPHPVGLRPGGGGGPRGGSPSSVVPHGSFIGRHGGANGYRIGSVGGRRGGSALNGRRGATALAGGRASLSLGGRRAGPAVGGVRGASAVGFRSARRLGGRGGFHGIGRRHSMPGHGGYRGDGIAYEDDYNGQDYADDYENAAKFGRGGLRG